MPKSDGLEACDLLKCNMSGEAVVEGAFSEIFSHMMLQADSFSFSGSSKFCNKCFKKVYENTPGAGESFEVDKKVLADKIQARLAGKAAANDLLDWVGHLESLTNLSYLDSQKKIDLSRHACEAELAPFITGSSNPCGGEVTDEEYSLRRKNALEAAGLFHEENFKGLLKRVEELIDPKPNQNSCRAAYAFRQKLALETVENKKYKEAMKFLLDAGLETPAVSEMVRRNCADGALPEGDFIKEFSEAIVEHYSSLYKKVASENPELTGPDKREELKMKACKADPIFAAALCGQPLPGMSAGASEVFGSLAAKVEAAGNRHQREVSREAYSRNQILANTESSLSGLLRRGALSTGQSQSSPALGSSAILNKSFSFSATSNGSVNGSVDSSVNYEDYTAAFKKKISRRFLESLLSVPMAMDPSLKVALGSWKGICQASRDSREAGKSFFEAAEKLSADSTIESYTQATCGNLRRKLERKICASYPLTAQDGLATPEAPYSANDLKNAKSDTFNSLSGKNRVAANSLACEMNTLESRWGEGMFLPLDITTIGQGMSTEQSDHEKSLVARARKERSNFDRFMDDSNCDSQYLRLAMEAEQGGNSAGLANQNDRAMRAGVEDDPDISLEDRVSVANCKSRGGMNCSAGAAFLKGDEGDVQAPSGIGGGFEDSGIEGRNIASVEAQNTNPFEDGLDDFIMEAENSSDFAEQEDSTAQDEFRNLFDKVGNTEADQKFGSPLPDYGAASAAQIAADEARRAAEKKKNGAEVEEVAEELGFEDVEESPEDLKKLIGDALDDKLNSEELKKLKEENQKLRDEMAAIRKQLEERPAKVVDSKGVDRSGLVEKPESNPQVVFNPRTPEPEFRSRSYFESEKEKFSPDFQDSGRAERVSFQDYSAERRAAATRMRDEQVTRQNGEIDRSFLQRNPSAQVNEEYVQDYVEYVGQSSGSIEHLIIYENGLPAKIRVPDPKNPGKFLEQPIAQDMVEVILEKVEKDETESYALYNMVNLGDSLMDYMQSLERDNHNLTLLSQLNETLTEAKDMESASP